MLVCAVFPHCDARLTLETETPLVNVVGAVTGHMHAGTAAVADDAEIFDGNDYCCGNCCCSAAIYSDNLITLMWT